jgi:hypothetical protein
MNAFGQLTETPIRPDALNPAQRFVAVTHDFPHNSQGAVRKLNTVTSWVFEEIRY